MFEQDLNAEKNQDDTSGKLCFRFVSCPEYVSDFYTCGSDDKRYYADKSNGRNNMYI